MKFTVLVSRAARSADSNGDAGATLPDECPESEARCPYGPPEAGEGANVCTGFGRCVDGEHADGEQVKPSVGAAVDYLWWNNYYCEGGTNAGAPCRP